MIRILYGLILLGVALVFYLSWVPNPDLHFVRFVPGWVARWADQEVNEDLRTGVPFVFLGLLAGLLFAQRPDDFFRWFISWLILTGVVVIAEVGQLWLPKRTFSWIDIGWGAAGALVGLIVAALLQKIKFIPAKKQ